MSDEIYHDFYVEHVMTCDGRRVRRIFWNGHNLYPDLIDEQKLFEAALGERPSLLTITATKGEGK
jgi:hypothetical protein